jgi:hypothetical protein
LCSYAIQPTRHASVRPPHFVLFGRVSTTTASVKPPWNLQCEGVSDNQMPFSKTKFYKLFGKALKRRSNGEYAREVTAQKEVNTEG